MKKRIISVMLLIAAVLSVISVSGVSASAASYATVKVGKKTYTAKVGQSFCYTVRMTNIEKLTTAQVEIPVDFSILSGPSQKKVTESISDVCPTTSSTSQAVRFLNSKSSYGIYGYVINFANPKGYGFYSNNTFVKLTFTVLKAGAVDLTPRFRDVNDLSGKQVVDKSGKVIGQSFTTTTSTDLSEQAADTSYPVSAPRITSFSNNASGIHMVWNSSKKANRYRVYRKRGTSYTKIAEVTGTSYTDTDVKSGTSYTYTVRAVSDDSKKFLSDYIAAGFTTKFLSAPKLSKAESVYSGVKVSWVPVSGAVKYRVYVKSGTGWKALGLTKESSYIHTAAVSGNTYTYTVRCASSSGVNESYYVSKGVSAKYIAAPAVSSVTNNTSAQKVSWGKVTGAAKYRVFVKTDGSWTKLTDTTALSYTNRNVKSGTKYTYTVRCISSDSKSYTSGYSSTGKSLTFVSAPKISSCVNGDTGVTVKWNKVIGASRYRVFVKASNGWTKLSDTADASYVHTSAKSGTKYIYTVRAMDSSSKYVSSFYSSGYSNTYIAQPKISSLTSASKGVKLSWGKVTGAEKYRVFLKTSSGWKRLADTASASYEYKDVKNGGKYTFTVRCISADTKTYTSSYDTKGKTITYKKP